MRNLSKLFEFIALVAIFGLIFACKDPSGNSAPALTGTVTITGTAQVGQVLTANTANLGGSGLISFQ